MISIDCGGDAAHITLKRLSSTNCSTLYTVYIVRVHCLQLKELSVPVEEAEVPDYYIYIKVPMDLSTIDKVCGLMLSG